MDMKAAPSKTTAAADAVSKPRDLKQVQYASKAAALSRRLGPNTMDNISILYYHLIYPYISPDLHYIYKVNIVGNITIELHCHDALAALSAVLDVDNTLQMLFYDTTFLYGMICIND
jgi:hypothetical protein